MASKTWQRMLGLEGGRRVPIKLDAPTWQAIEWLATRTNSTWQEWCANAIARTDDGENMTATIREAAMSGLLKESVFADREEQIAAMELHPLMKNSGILDDHQLAEILKKARVAGHADFGGFSVRFGMDEHFQDCVWIENGLRGGPHFAFSLPVDNNQ